MKKLINISKCLIYFVIILILYILIMSIFEYFNIFSYKVINIINYIFMILLFTFVGFKLSKYEGKRGYLNGFLISLILIITFILLSLIWSKFSLPRIVYYLSLILSSITGGIIGIQNKKL